METEEEYREQFLLSGIASGPATPEKIDQLEERLGVPLPTVYRAYLRCCGTHPPRALVGSACVMGDLLSNFDAAKELLAECKVALPSQPIVVFLMHQGYFFQYFPIDGTPDPPVYSYREGDSEPQKSAAKFSHWVQSLSSLNNKT